ncbi:MAG: hypothetical protein AAFN59_06685 [Pseudomonadota bacterium]
MQNALDTVFTLSAAALMAGLSLTAFARTDAGDPTSGWRDGAYQRGFEERFERSVPTHEGSVALWAGVRWALFNEPSAGAIASKDGWLFTSEEFIEPSETRDFALELERVAARLSGAGINLVPVVIPDKARMQGHRLARGRSDGFENRYARALGTIGQADLPVIDLRPVLDFNYSYQRTDTHWSPEGARRVAGRIAARLADFDLPKTVVETKSNGVAGFEGDLLTFVATGAFSDLVGPAAEGIATFETSVAASGDLFGDAVVPVALVGTSYSAKPEFHFAGFLKQSLQADVLNASVVGQGPFAPMDTFLTELEQLSSPPSLVLWEIPERFLTSRSPLQ